MKTLWNMPLNLEFGPQLYQDNPGIGFDPNTEPDPSRGSGFRRLTGDAAGLQTIEDLYWAAQMQNRDPDEKEWQQMATALRSALVAYEERAQGLLLAQPLNEQWTADPPDPQAQRWWFQRKRLRRFPGAKKGEATFADARGLLDPLPAAGDANAVPPTRPTCRS